MSLKQKAEKSKFFKISNLGHFALIFVFASFLVLLSLNLKEVYFLIKNTDKSEIIKDFSIQYNISEFEPPKKTVGAQGSWEVAASKRGSKYYFPKCSGLKQIKAENLVFFASEEAAKMAGYELAKNCKK